MSFPYFRIVAVAALFVLGGCASMSEEECAAGDWYAMGFEDGVRGYSSDRFAGVRKVCAQHGIKPDFKDYRAGRTEGLQEFCQPQQGFNYGVDGGRYAGVCPAHLETGFIDAYRSGARLYGLRSNVDAANQQIYAREQALDNIRNSIRSKEAQLIASDTSIQNRVLILSDLKQLNERTGQLEAEIVGLVDDRARHEQELLAYEVVLADSGY